MPRRLGAAAALFLAALIGTTACSGGQPPPSAQTTAAPAESSAFPSPATALASPSAAPAYKPADASGRAQNVPVPVLPEAARAETKEGLEAFAKYWYSTLTYAYETGDMAPLEAITEDTCNSCVRVKEVVNGWHSEGRWLAGGKMIIEGMTSDFKPDSGGGYQVLIQVRQEPLSYYRADKVLDERAQPSPAVGDIMIAHFRAGAWSADSVEHLVKSK